MKKEELFLEKALSTLGLDKLPEEKKGPFDGLAVVKIEKENGVEMYAIGRHSKKAKKTVVAQDFSKHLSVKRIIAIYPFIEKKDYKPTELESMRGLLVMEGYDMDDVGKWPKARCQKAINEIKDLKDELAKLKVTNAKGTVEQLQEILKKAKDLNGASEDSDEDDDSGDE